MSNIYKPRYKICYQTKNKVWIYKNSRLRKFYNIRSRNILNPNKQFLVTKNMKWTVARRAMTPYTRKRINFMYNYKNSLYLKQQVKNFYGKIREYKLRSLFRNSWNNKQFFKRNIFVSSLEQRLDMVVFRMRILPTIFSCHQMIDHQGVLVNNKVINIPGYKLKIGDIVSIKKELWPIFYKALTYKLSKRVFGHRVLIWRKHRLFATLQRLLISKDINFESNLLFQRNLANNLKKFKHLDNFINQKYNYYKSLKPEDFKKPENQKQLYFYKVIKYTLIKKIKKELNFIRKNLIKINAPSNTKPEYYTLFNDLIKKNYQVSQLFLLINFSLREHNINCILSSQINAIYNNPEIPDNLKENKILPLIGNRTKLMAKFTSQYNEKRKDLKKNLELFVKDVYLKYWKRGPNLYNNKEVLLETNRKAQYLLRSLKHHKKKKKRFKSKSLKHHWYTPNYLEVDYKTLRASFIRYPNENEVFYGFPCSFGQIISFYKGRAL